MMTQRKRQKNWYEEIPLFLLHTSKSKSKYCYKVNAVKKNNVSP